MPLWFRCTPVATFWLAVLTSSLQVRGASTISRAAQRMSWQSHGNDNPSLVDALWRNKLIESDEVRQALLSVDRGNYAPRLVGDRAYHDNPLPIGNGQTISAPHMHAMCLELLKDYLKPGARALDVGSGSGYLTGAMTAMVGPKGKVFGIEYVPELAKASVENLKRDHKDDLIESGRLAIKQGDGSLGWPEHAPFDAIHVGAAAAVMPEKLVEQLKAPGRMVIPVGPQDGEQYLIVLTKKEDGTIQEEKQMGVRYVPLHMRDH